MEDSERDRWGRRNRKINIGRIKEERREWSDDKRKKGK